MVDTTKLIRELELSEKFFEGSPGEELYGYAATKQSVVCRLLEEVCNYLASDDLVTMVVSITDKPGNSKDAQTILECLLPSSDLPVAPVTGDYFDILDYEFLGSLGFQLGFTLCVEERHLGKKSPRFPTSSILYLAYTREPSELNMYLGEPDFDRLRQLLGL
jgi:hypothetical protein